MNDGWNPWYVEYARYHGREPDEQYAHDRNHYKNIPILPYTRWIQEQWIKYRAERGLPERGRPDKAMQSDFTAWLRGE